MILTGPFQFGIFHDSVIVSRGSRSSGLRPWDKSHRRKTRNEGLQIKKVTKYQNSFPAIAFISLLLEESFGRISNPFQYLCQFAHTHCNQYLFEFGQRLLRMLVREDHISRLSSCWQKNKFKKPPISVKWIAWEIIFIPKCNHLYWIQCLLVKRKIKMELGSSRVYKKTTFPGIYKY